MALITRKDLEQRGKHSYIWTASKGDDPTIIGKVDAIRVSKKEGYEVLHLINALADKWGFKNKESAFKLEDMIHHSAEMMRDKISAWISANWKTWKA